MPYYCDNSETEDKSHFLQKIHIIEPHDHAQ